MKMVSKSKKKSKKQTVFVNNPQACVFCNETTSDEIRYGGMKQTKQIRAHYYCLLLSSTIKQLGQDDEGILGFLVKDIINELRNTKNNQCCYCKKFGANLICTYEGCPRKFHLPCGINNNTQHNFNTFTSLCHNHRQLTNIPVYIKKALRDYECLVCLEQFDSKENISNIIWANCCKSDVVLHLPCIQQLALSAGYFTKCPGCNNRPKFTSTIKSLGVFVPERDASWELERNAFSELLFVHDTCDVVKCICPEGRNYNASKGPWKLVLCNLCGSSGAHMNCSSIKRKFVCDICKLDKSADINTPTGECSVTLQTAVDNVNACNTNLVLHCKNVDNLDSTKMMEDVRKDIEISSNSKNGTCTQHDDCDESVFENTFGTFSLNGNFAHSSPAAQEIVSECLQEEETYNCVKNNFAIRSASSICKSEDVDIEEKEEDKGVNNSFASVSPQSDIFVPSSLKRKISESGDENLEFVRTKLAKSNECKDSYLENTNSDGTISIKQNSVCFVNIKESLKNQRMCINFSELNNLLNLVKNVKEKSSITDCSTGEENVNQTKTADFLGQDPSNSEGDYTIQVIDEYNGDESLLNKENFPVYKVYVDSSSEIEFINYSGVNNIRRSLNNLCKRTNENMVSEKNEVHQEEEWTDFEENSTNEQNCVEPNFEVESGIKINRTSLIENSQMQSYFKLEDKNYKKIIEISFDDQDTCLKNT